MNECTTSIAKAFAHIVSVLGHTKSSADPSLHIQPLVVHLATVLQTSPPALPSPLLKVLKPLAQDSMSVQHTAELLCALLLRARMFEGLPSGPVAAGAFLLALEALGRVQLPSLGILAGALGSRVGAAASTVLSRYRVARTLAEEWTRALPWTHLRGSSKGGKRAPSGEGKRTLVARALKDALDFQEDIWRKKVGLIPGLALEVNHDDDDEFISLVRNPDTARDGTPARPSPHKAGAAMKRKRSTEEDLIDVEAAEGVLRARLAPKRRPSTPQAVEKSLSFLLGSSPANGRRNLPIAGKASAVSHLLLADTDPHLRTPSRLAVLASINGGSGPEHIVDDDLFVPGELEELLRTADERDALARMVDWGDSLPTDRAPRRPRGEKVKAPKGVERINMDQLARLLDDTGDADATAQGPPSLEADLDWGGFIPFDDDGKEEDAAFGSTCTSRNLSTGSLAAAVADTVDDDEVEEWRPASPTSGCLDASDWYEF
jgi:transcription factor IIIB subunit 2